MGKISKFEITLAENKLVYFPGDIVAGNLALKLKDSMEMKDIKVTCTGKAYVHWTETRTVSNGKTTTTHTDHYKAEEKYFKFSLPVAGKGVAGNDNSKTTLPAGSQLYSFSFQLPAALPSSFEGGTGYVRYFIKAEIDRPWKFDHTTKQMFTVLDVLDLNQEPNARVRMLKAYIKCLGPSGKNESKYLCCGCCKSGPIEVDVHTDRLGYVPGEVILINASLENHSNSKVKETNAYLKQETRFITSRKTKTTHKTIAKIEGRRGCKKHKSMTWKNEKLQIPSIPPSEMRNCKIIDVNYYIEFEGVLRSLSINLRANVPLLIGTVPLTGIQPTMMDQKMEDVTAPSAPPDLGEVNPAYQPPPPSYMSAIGSEPVNIREEDDSEHMMGASTYNPQYAYYDWSQTAFKYN